MAQHGRASVDGPLEQLHVASPRSRAKPRLGYAESSLERATERRADASALAAFADDQHARAYLVAGDSIILNQAGAVCDPLFTLAQARTFGRTVETVFLDRKST